MHLTVDLQSGDVFSIEVEGQTDIGTLKALLEAETGIAADKLFIRHNGRLLPASGTLQNAQVQDNDVVVVSQQMHMQHQPVPSPQPPQQHPAAVNTDGTLQNPQAYLHAALSNPAMLAAYPPEIRDAVSTGDIGAVQRAFQQMQETDRMLAEVIRPGEDENDPEVQKRIAEYIRKKNIQDNLEAAWEHNPEVFGHINMLYVNMEVNKHKIAAFIDSGAQITVMSAKTAESCNLLRLMDTRCAGIVTGVGTAKVLGKVHQAPLKIGNQQVTASITILEQDSMKFLFGLDMLRRYQCSIDLHKHVLRFGSINNAELPFLAEHELPDRLQRELSDKQAGGSGRLDADAGAGPSSGPAAIPSAATPSAATPSVAVPSATAPNAARRNAAVPQATMPNAVIPNAAPGGATTLLDRNAAGAAAAALSAALLSAAAGRGAGITSLGGRPAAAAPAAAPARTTLTTNTHPAASGAASSGALNRPAGVDQAAVQRLVGLGFTPEESLQTLQVCNGDVEQAASLLFSTRFGG